jgi:DNA-binding SARP family transcriptional activator
VADQLWPRSRAKAVVKLLALSPDHRLHREQLMELLWPGLASAAAGANLRKAVHFARRALGPEHLQLRERVLGIEAIDLWIDVDAFTAAAASGLVDEAIDLYGGELLPEGLLPAPAPAVYRVGFRQAGPAFRPSGRTPPESRKNCHST